jgi:hypothetical protein
MFYESRQEDANAIPVESFIVSVFVRGHGLQMRLFYSCSLEITGKLFNLHFHKHSEICIKVGAFNMQCTRFIQPGVRTSGGIL